MARTPKDLPAIQDRRAQVVKLRAQGLTWDQIAERVGYANGSSALKAWRTAIKQTPDLAVKEIRAAERERLSEMDATLAGIVADPPVKVTAIGKTQYDDQGRPVKDMAVVISAIRERRQVGESYRRLTAADAAPPRGAGLTEDQARIMAEVIAAQRDRAREGSLIPLPSLPGNYGSLTPHEQMQADLARRRTQLAALPAPQDDDVIEAEIVDE